MAARKLYIKTSADSEFLLQVLNSSGITINKGSITLGGVTYEFDNSDIDYSELVITYVNKKMTSTTDYNPAWSAEGSKKRWNYIDGVFIEAILNLYKHTKESKYLDFAVRYTNYYINSDGSFIDPSTSKARYTATELDCIAMSKPLFDLYQMTGDSRYLTGIEYTYAQLMNTSNIPICVNGINFSHKLAYENQIWCDGTYMYMPFLARYALLHNNPTVTVGNNTAPIFDILKLQLQYIREHMKDTSGLYRHAHDTKVPAGGTAEFWAESDGNSENVWGRGTSWITVALVNMLEYFPEGSNKEYVKSMFQELMASYLPYITSNNMLRQLPTLSDPADGYTNYEEQSCSSMVAYAMMKGARNGYLASSYLTTGQNLFKGVFNTSVTITETENTETKVTTKDLSVSNICVTAGFPNTKTSKADANGKDGTVKYYLSVAEKGSDDAKGTGPFIMSYLQYDDRANSVHTVTLNDASGYLVNNSLKVNHNERIYAPINIRDGRTVTWQLDGAEYDFTQPVTSDLTLNAVWDSVSTYTVTFISNGSTYSTATVQSGGKVTKPSSPTRSGYTFDGWYDGADEFDFNTQIYADLTLTAKWTEVTQTYTISYSTAHGTAPSTKTVASGYALTTNDLPSLTYADYNFGGWYEDSSYGTKAAVGDTITSNTTLYAKWTEAQGITLYTLNGSTEGSLSQSMGTDGVFGYVDGNKSGTAVPMELNSSGYFVFNTNYENSLELTAQVYGPCVIRVTAKSKGGSGKVSYVGVSNGTSSSDWNVDAESGATESSHIFVLEETGTQTIHIYRANYSYTETLYISKVEIAAGTNDESYFGSKYTINYSTARGTAPSSKSVASGYPLTSSDLPSLTADNYTFNGWYLDSSYGTQATAGYAITANTTLYAKWTESGGETTYILDYSVDKTMSSSMGTDGAFSYVGNVTYDSSLGYKFGSNMSQTNNYLAINVNGTITISVEQYSNNTAAGIRIMKEDGTVLYSGTPTATKTHETLSNISLGTYSGKLLIGRYGGSTVSTRKITITVSN